jgi:hypothetical protein
MPACAVALQRMAFLVLGYHAIDSAAQGPRFPKPGHLSYSLLFFLQKVEPFRKSGDRPMKSHRRGISLLQLPSVQPRSRTTDLHR